MAGILYDARKVKVYEALQELCRMAAVDRDWGNELWRELLGDDQLLEEMVYYMEHHSFLGELKFEGYSLMDLYVWQMDLYNLIGDYGKNPVSCNKETMVLRAFRTMADMKRNPEYYKKKLAEGPGMDRYF